MTRLVPVSFATLFAIFAVYRKYSNKRAKNNKAYAVFSYQVYKMVLLCCKMAPLLVKFCKITEMQALYAEHRSIFVVCDIVAGLCMCAVYV